MVGRSMLAEEEDAVDFNKTPKKNSDSGESEFKTIKELVSMFRILLDSYLDEFFPGDTLPMTGDGKPVDIFLIFLNVTHKSGIDAVENVSWDEIAQECGLGFNNSASAKSIYVKYLDTLAQWLYGTSVELFGISDDLLTRLQHFLSEVKRKYEMRKGKPAKESGVEFRWFISKTKRRFGKEQPLMADNKLEKVMMCNQECSSPPGKRKRECSLETLKWLSDVAKDPSDPLIGTLPDSSMWGAYGDEESWKQLLLFKASRTNTDAACEKKWKKLQKMHPSLYDDSTGPIYNLRERQILNINEKKAEKGNTSSTNASASDPEEDRPCPLLGSDFQAEVPEWTELTTSETDPKWLGTRIWPLSKEHNNKNLLIERDPIGKGRPEHPCGCQIPTSIECVKFHITTKQEKLKLELGPAFYLWCFDTMGEGTMQYWSEYDQKKVKALITNPPTLSLVFFDQLKKILAYKSRGKIVSYFYNVILLQFRANQSRLSPDDVCSDTDTLYDKAREDQDSDISQKPVLLSPKKRRRR